MIPEIMYCQHMIISDIFPFIFAKQSILITAI